MFTIDSMKRIYIDLILRDQWNSRQDAESTFCLFCLENIEWIHFFAFVLFLFIKFYPEKKIMTKCIIIWNISSFVRKSKSNSLPFSLFLIINPTLSYSLLIFSTIFSRYRYTTSWINPRHRHACRRAQPTVGKKTRVEWFEINATNWENKRKK